MVIHEAVKIAFEFWAKVVIDLHRTLKLAVGCRELVLGMHVVARELHLVNDHRDIYLPEIDQPRLFIQRVVDT